MADIKEQIEELKRLMAEATPGPWHVSSTSIKGSALLSAEGDGNMASGSRFSIQMSENNAKLIALLRNLAGELVAAYDDRERLREIIDEQRLTIRALNTKIGGEGSLSLENIKSLGELEQTIVAQQARIALLIDGMDEYWQTLPEHAPFINAVKNDLSALAAYEQRIRDEEWNKTLEEAARFVIDRGNEIGGAIQPVRTANGLIALKREG